MQGFFIEVNRSQADAVPADYLRRQTVKSAERFITPELKSFEDKVLGARDRALARERELYDGLLDVLTAAPAGTAAHAPRRSPRSTCWLLRGARASRSTACGPELIAEPMLRIDAGRHPVVERAAPRAVHAERPAAR